MIKKRSAQLVLGLAALLAVAAGSCQFTTSQAGEAPALSVAAASSAAIPAEDVDATVRWYRDQLGFRVIADRATVKGRTVVLENRGMLLEVAEADMRPQAAIPADVEVTGSLVRHKLSILVRDVDAEVERLRGRNVIIAGDPEDDLSGHFRTASIRDPEGHILELREPLTNGTGDMP